LRSLRATPFMAAILPAPDEAAIAPLVQMRNAGLGVLAVVVDSEPFSMSDSGRAQKLAATLEASGVNARVLGREKEWEKKLMD
ncbi:MAG: hypothetical protein ACRDH2_21455, partial [Anaerolineales bacterium]